MKSFIVLSASSALLLLLAPVAQAEVLAPPITLTGTFLVAVTGDGLHDALLRLDTGQTQHLSGQNATRLQLTISSIPDGAHAWELRYTDDDGAHVERGIVTVQDITSVLVAQVSRAVEASQEAQVEALASQAASFAAMNVSLQARDASQQAVALMQAVPTDLVRRGDLAPFASGLQDLAGTAAQTRLDVQAGMRNQSKALEAGHTALTGIARTVGALVVVAFFGVLLAGFYVVRQGRELRRNRRERQQVEARLKALEARSLLKPESKPLAEADLPPLPPNFPGREPPGFPPRRLPDREPPDFPQGRTPKTHRSRPPTRREPGRGGNGHGE
jgi:hypothetical protein